MYLIKTFKVFCKFKVEFSAQIVDIRAKLYYFATLRIINLTHCFLIICFYLMEFVRKHDKINFVFCSRKTIFDCLYAVFSFLLLHHSQPT